MLTNKLGLRKVKKVLLYQTLVLLYMKRHKKVYATITNLKYQLLSGMLNLSYQIDHILSYYISDIQNSFEYILKSNEKIGDLSISIYVNKIENRITFKTKAGYYIELLTPETMKFFGSTKNKTTKDKNGENAPHLETTEVVFGHCNNVNNDSQQDSRVLYTIVPNKVCNQFLEISVTNFILLKIFNSEFKDIEV